MRSTASLIWSRTNAQADRRASSCSGGIRAIVLTIRPHISASMLQAERPLGRTAGVVRFRSSSDRLKSAIDEILNFGGVSLINLPLIRLNRRTLLKFHCDLPECMEARQSLCRVWETPAIDVACFGNCCWRRGVRKDFRQNRRLFLPVNSARARAFTFNKSLKDRVAGVTTLTLERAKLQVR